MNATNLISIHAGSVWLTGDIPTAAFMIVLYPAAALDWQEPRAFFFERSLRFV